MKNLALATLLVALTCAACADGTIVFIDDDDDNPDTIEVVGNIRDVNPQVAGADIVVFVFTDLTDANPPFENFRKQRSVIVQSAADPMEFTVTQVESGKLTVVFLQDDVGDPDGQVDPGDPRATLLDPDGVLDSVQAGETIRVSDIDIDFDDDPPGTADAESIRSVRDTGVEE